jgi:hypothetical protein
LDEPGFNVDIGGPSNEKRVNWASALFSAGATEPYIPPPPFADGYATVSEFLPDLTGWLDGPIDFFLGPFESVRDEWVIYDEQYGWFHRGVALDASADITTPSVYRSLFVSISTPFDWSGFVADPVITYENDVLRLTMATQFGIYDGKVSGDPLLGFDGMSNPVAQLLPLGVARTIQVETFPHVADVDYVFGLYAGDDVAFTPSSVIQAATPVQATASGSEREIYMQIPATRSTMAINVHSQRTLNVGIYYVVVRDFLPGDSTGRIITPVPKTIVAGDLKNRLNQLIGKQTNVYFEVENVEGAAGQLEYNTGVGTSEVTIDDTFRADQICDIRTIEKLKFQNKARDDSYHLSVFVWPPGFMGYSRPGTPNPSVPPVAYASGAAEFPSNFAFVWSATNLDTVVHEFGHMFGLQHAFAMGTGYGPDNIPDNSQERLMGYDNTNRKLIKPERDIIRRRAKFLLGESPTP